eukprot:TRINITY_DN412_c2_g1_i1.p1 TRINITY_DN412_c2_g1~~TRINITY_DN412_c2_g1_i1.p1  ORF type:complete len:102 (+),score=15.75 TRINITY_DN412_c2_g1_i1:63-368(+)
MTALKSAAFLALLGMVFGVQFPSSCDHRTRVANRSPTGTITQSAYGKDVHLCWFIQCREGDLSLEWTHFDLESTHDYLTLSKVDNCVVSILRINSSNTEIL